MDQEVFKIASQALLFVVLIVSAVTDLRDRKVYDWLTLPGIAFGLTLGWANGELGSCALGFAVAVGVFGFAVWIGGMGGGDLKLMAAIGAIQGYPFVVHAIFWSSLAGAVLALGKLAWDGLLTKGLWRTARYLFTLKPESGDGELLKQKIPYGVAISAGTFASWFFWVMEGTTL